VSEEYWTKSMKNLSLSLFVLTFMVPSIAAAAIWTEAEADTVVTAPPEVDRIFVWGKREGVIGEAVSASQGEVSYGQYAIRPLLRAGELVEVIPGLAATQHSGSGKANQYFLRGFNLDHGTDFSVSLDGVPLNLRTHAHGQGYLDLNGITPELVHAIEYRKGPYYPEAGDFSAAGSAAFRTFDHLEENLLQVQAGQNGFARLTAGLDLGSGLLGLDMTRSDGPWDTSEDLEKASLLGRWRLGDWSFSGLAYHADWTSTDQIPERAVAGGLVSRLGTIDPTDGGKTSRFILSARSHPDSNSDLVVYVQRYRVSLWSNFTYSLEDPVNGDQFEQSERRWIFGASGYRGWTLSDAWRVRLGAESRLDDIGAVGLYRTKARRRLDIDREDEVQELSGAAWAEATWQGAALRAQVSLRADAIAVDVTSGDRNNSGRASDTLISPKLALAWRLSPTVELYGDVGRGYHSNDARGAVQTVSPTTAAPVDKVALIAAADGAEIGARFERRGFSASASLWALRLASELVYVGDAGETEATGATERLGAEILVNWSPDPALNFDLSAASTHARYRDVAAGEDRIPNALEYVLTGGMTARLTPIDTIQLTVRRLGPAPLVEDNSARSDPSTVVNFAYARRLGLATLSLDVLNLFDRDDHDITYFYASRLAGEPLDGTEDTHFHPLEPRQFRLGLRYAF